LFDPAAGGWAGADVTTWGWVRGGFYHLAVAAGAAAVAEMLRTRVRSGAAGPPVVVDDSKKTTKDGRV
jgi:hypothetical protein